MVVVPTVVSAARAYIYLSLRSLDSEPFWSCACARARIGTSPSPERHGTKPKRRKMVIEEEEDGEDEGPAPSSREFSLYLSAAAGLWLMLVQRHHRAARVVLRLRRRRRFAMRNGRRRSKRPVLPRPLMVLRRGAPRPSRRPRRHPSPRQRQKARRRLPPQLSGRKMMWTWKMGSAVQRTSRSPQKKMKKIRARRMQRNGKLRLKGVCVLPLQSVHAPTPDPICSAEVALDRRDEMDVEGWKVGDPCVVFRTLIARARADAVVPGYPMLRSQRHSRSSRRRRSG